MAVPETDVVGAGTGGSDSFARALAFHQQGRLQEAEAGYREVLAAEPGHAGALHYLGTIALQTGDPERAASLLSRALERAPGDAEAHDHLGLALRELGRPEESAASLRRALELQPDAPAALSNLAATLLDLGEAAQAAEAARRALELLPELPGALANLGQAYKELGRLAEAEDCWRRALVVAPDLVGAHAGLVELRPCEAGDPALARLEALTGGEVLGRRERELLHFTLARMWDDAGDVERAWRHASRGNGLRRARLGRFDVAALAARYGELFRLPADRFSGTGGDSGELPVFIVGMPRSGTTLVERLLAGHPRVLPGGELPHLCRLSARVYERGGPLRVHLDAQWRGSLAADYLGLLPPRPASVRRVTDKMPHNFELLWLVALLLPNARVVHCRRDPLDTCLSCWFRDFAAPHAYKHDLRTLGRAYVLYRRLMAHWERVLPLRLLHVDYERLVADPEAQARRLVRFAGLEWDDRCLALDDRGPHLRTLTARQRTARSINVRGVDRWRRYEAHLGELLDALREEEP